MAAKTGSALCVGAVVLTIASSAFVIFGQPDTPAAATIHVDIAESAQAMALGAHFADFGTETPSTDARQIADWVADSRDNAGADFFIVDKNYARVYVFDVNARLRGAAPVLLGAARGDHSVPGIAARPIDQVRPAERTTPAGRFLAERGLNSFGEDVVWVDYDAAVSMHRVRTTNPKERRLERLATPTVGDNRISYGCINVPVAFYEEYIGPTVALRRAVIYVLPDFDSAQRLFGSYDVASVHGLISNHSTSAACNESACAGAQSRWQRAGVLLRIRTRSPELGETNILGIVAVCKSYYSDDRVPSCISHQERRGQCAYRCPLAPPSVQAPTAEKGARRTRRKPSMCSTANRPGRRFGTSSHREESEHRHHKLFVEKENRMANQASGGFPNLRMSNLIPGWRGLTGDVVYDAAGEYVGHIEEIMVDTRIGYVAYAVIGVGGFLGIGKKRFAIPWSVVVPDPHAKRCALKIDHARLLGSSLLSA